MGKYHVPLHLLLPDQLLEKVNGELVAAVRVQVEHNGRKHLACKQVPEEGEQLQGCPKTRMQESAYG